MSCTKHLPVNRGFSSSFGYLSGAEDHYDDTRSGYVDLWRSSSAAFGENGSLPGGYDYNTYKFTREAVSIVEAHPAERPLFIYLAYQNVHGPTQAPDNYTALYDAEIYHPRLMCLAMIAAVDESIGKVTQSLQSRGLWNNTLVIFSSDNGGPADHANNWPLRGSKGSGKESEQLCQAVTIPRLSLTDLVWRVCTCVAHTARFRGRDQGLCVFEWRVPSPRSSWPKNHGDDAHCRLVGNSERIDWRGCD